MMLNFCNLYARSTVFAIITAEKVWNISGKKSEKVENDKGNEMCYNIIVQNRTIAKGAVLEAI
jgi:hypothetical protein